MINTNQNILFLATILALCVISFMHVFLFPIYGGIASDLGLHKRNSKTYREFEQSLCLANLKWIGKGRLCRSTGTGAGCPQDGIVTVIQGGRLGNQMWEYASVWAIARRTGLEPYIPRCIKTKLDQVFDSTMTVPSLDEIGHCQVNLDRFVTSLDMWNYTNQSIVLPRYSAQADVVLSWVQDIRQEFTFKKKLLIRRDQILRQALQATIGTRKNITQRILDTLKPVYIGVHVRRTDYIGYLWRKHGRRPAPPRYYLNAMRGFDTKYATPTTPVIHVIVSDDPSWCKRMLLHAVTAVKPTKSPGIGSSNVHVVTANIVGLDLAILAACNHSVLDYGTFGVWAAILAGGETVYYNLSMHLSARVGELMPKWRAMS